MKSNDGKEAADMKIIAAVTKKRTAILFVCLLFALLLACGLYLLRWRRMKAASAEPASQPISVLQQKYMSRYPETPVPTLPSPYLSTPAPTAEPAVEPSPAPQAEGLLGGKYAWRFSQEEILTDHSYSNPSVSISWDAYRDEVSYSKPVTFYLADVLVQDVTSLRTAFARGTYSAGGVKAMEAIAKNNRCIVAISGDFARWHKNGLIVRNGEVFRKQRYTSDLCVLYKNGVMETYVPGTLSLEKIMEMDPWQSWHFGPELLDQNGLPKTKFNTTVAVRNPRSAIGYYEPGHYCLLVVDGRQGRYSGGLTMSELSRLMYTLGCVRAYNLDGGATVHMSWGNTVINSPSKDRKVHDVICVCFPAKT